MRSVPRCGFFACGGEVFRRRSDASLGRLRGGAAGDDVAADLIRAGSEVDDVVGDDAHVQLDHDDGVACFDEGLQVGDEAVGVGAVQSRGRLVEHVEGVLALGALQFAGEL